MATDSRKKYGMLIGVGVIAAAAVVVFSLYWPPSRGTEGAIGQRHVYRDGTVLPKDVKADPGKAPIAIKAFLKSKKFKKSAKKRGFVEVDSKEFAALTDNADFINFLSTPGLRTFGANPLMPKVLQAIRSNSGKPMTLQQVETALGAESKTPAFARLQKNTSFQRWLQNPAGVEAYSNVAFQKFLTHPILTAKLAIVQPRGVNLDGTDLNADLNADLNTDLNADLSADLNADLNADFNSDLNADLNFDLNFDLNMDHEIVAAPPLGSHRDRS